MYWLIISILVIELDQLLKIWTTTYLSGSTGMVVIEGFFRLNYVENTGAAFGSLQNMSYIFIPITAVVIIILIAALIFDYFESPLVTVSFALIIGGGIGNLINRVVNGYVVDMCEFSFVNFAVFNVADAAITIGGILFLYCIIFDKRTVETLTKKKIFKKKERVSAAVSGDSENSDSNDKKTDS